MKLFFRGLKSGVPIGLGYLSVSFAFGIMAISLGFSWWQAVLISAFTVTSAGQLAAISMMTLPSQYLPLLISQCTINLRYAFMSVSLSQKVSKRFSGIKRWALGFFMTDEIFAVASREACVEPLFFAGLATVPWLGWTLGTLMGALIGNILPDILIASLSIAIYGMFLAIIVPPAKKSRAVLTVALIATCLHCVLSYLPLLKEIPSGIAISLSAILAALLGALLFPISTDEEVSA